MMVRVYYFTGHNTISWPTVLLIVYGVLALITAVFALILAYHGDTPYRHVPERYRNRRWVKPLISIIFIILPALLWPIVMVGLGIFVIGCFLFDTEDGILKKMKGGRKEKDVEKGLGIDVSLNQQSTPEHNPAVTRNSANATTISELPPAHKPHDSSRRLLLDGEIAR
ncbi:hypothetical protein INS49_003399 [Diaporthe citri]|uniref:uncharacterized protein n=1 Tax=Diaporthe citri TaxID=83186 RepID=UPI001C7EE8E4|nr:uncharacterized protein INS49_003399 [Diaporthe citri]KAG6355437.1 hypothetical protein INS49_003399 [Diaporthe citri]